MSQYDLSDNFLREELSSFFSLLTDFDLNSLSN